MPSLVRIVNQTNFVLDISALPAWTAEQCTSTTTGIRCTSPDRALKLLLTARAPSPTSIDFRVTVKHPGVPAPNGGPLSVAVGEPDGIYVGELTDCTTTASGTLRCRP